MIDDSHWKIIKYLTSNYKNILIGDMINYKKSFIFYNLFTRYIFFLKKYISSECQKYSI
jgi:hypothetical protein